MSSKNINLNETVNNINNNENTFALISVGDVESVKVKSLAYPKNINNKNAFYIAINQYGLFIESMKKDSAIDKKNDVINSDSATKEEKDDAKKEIENIKKAFELYFNALCELDICKGADDVKKHISTLTVRDSFLMCCAVILFSGSNVVDIKDKHNCCNLIKNYYAKYGCTTTNADNLKSMEDDKKALKSALKNFINDKLSTKNDNATFKNFSITSVTDKMIDNIVLGCSTSCKWSKDKIHVGDFAKDNKMKTVILTVALAEKFNFAPATHAKKTRFVL